MSAHNAKKKRMGSRRKAVNQNEMDERNERLLTDTSPAESCTSGKTTEETEVLHNPDSLTAVPPNWPSSELKEGKRKFGSRRKQKGLHAEDVATALHNKEDGDETTDNSKVTETLQVLMEIQTPNSPDLSQESETFVNADIHLHEPNPLCDSSELKEYSGRSLLGTGEDCSHASSENQTEDHTEKCSSQSEEMWSNSSHKSGLSLSEPLEENVQPFMISVQSDLTHEPSDTDMPEERSEEASEERKNDSVLLRHTEDFQALRFQNESPKANDSWLQINADLTFSSEQNETFPPNEGSLEEERKRHLDTQVDDHLISVDSEDRIHVQHDDSIENHEIVNTFESGTHDVTGRLTGEIGPSGKERVFEEVEQIDVSPEAEQNLLLSASDYNNRFTENTMAKTNNESIATTTVPSGIETEIQEDSMEPVLKDIDSTLTENSGDEIKKSIQILTCDDAAEKFSTDVKMEGMQTDQSHSGDELEKSRTDVSINKEEEVNYENKQDGYEAEGTGLGGLHQTSEECHLTKSTQATGMDREDTEPGGVYQTEDEDNETESKGSDVQVDFDLPATQLEKMHSVSSSVICRRKLGSSRKKKLNPNVQDRDLSQQPAEEATGHSDDHQPLESSESEVGDQVEGNAHGVAHDDRGFSWSADSYVSVDDEMEKLPVEDSLVQQSDSSFTSSSVVDRENMDPSLAENPSDGVKESMQTDILDAREHFSTDLNMGGMQIDQTHFTDMLEEFSDVHSGRETHSNKDSELLKDDHCASASPPISVNVSITSEIDARDLAVTGYSIDNTTVDLTEEHFSLVDGESDYQLEDVNGSNVLYKANCIEVDSKTGQPDSQSHQESFRGEDDVQGEESAGTSMDEGEKWQSQTGDLSSLHHSENSPINSDEKHMKASHMHDVIGSFENEISDTCMLQFGSKISTDVSVSKDEELNHEIKQEANPTKENDFGTFPQTRQMSRRKLGSSRKKKLNPNATNDADLSQQPAEEATGHSDDHEPLQSTVSLASDTEVSNQVEETALGVTHSDIPERDASNLLPSPTSVQQSVEGRQELFSMFSATEGKEQEEDSDSFGPDQNLHLLASESLMHSPYGDAFTVLITTEKSKEENQSDIENSNDPSALPEEDKEHVKPPEGRGLLRSVDGYGNDDEEAGVPPVDDSVVLQNDSVLQSDGESRDSELGEELLLSDKTAINIEIEESSNTHDGDIGKTRYESVNTDSIQAVEADSHPASEESPGENITINQALEEFAREVEPSVNMQVSGRDEIVENTSDPPEKTSALEENKEVDQFGVQGNTGGKPTADVPLEVQLSTAEGASSLQQVHLQSKQKRRKMGSTRRANFTRQQDKEMCTDSETKRTPADQSDFEKVEVVDERLFSLITDVSHGGNSEEPNNPQNIVCDNSRQSNTEANVEVDVNSAILDEVEDMRFSGRNSDAVMEELKPDGLIAAETASSVNPGHPTSTECSSESVDGVTQGAQYDEDRLESVLSDQLLESAAKLIVTANLEQVKSELGRGDGENPNEEVNVDEDLETRSASLSLKCDTKRRKMGSTRKSLASGRAGEDLSGKQGEDGEATNVQVPDGGAPKTEDNELTPQNVIVVETVERSCTSESYSRPQATTEEDRLGRSLTVSTAPQPDAMSETAAGGRRRKMGSHRKSHGYQRNRDLAAGQEETGDSGPEASRGSLTNDKVTQTAEGRSPRLQNIPEDTDEKKTPSNTITGAAEPPKPLHQKTSTHQAAAQQSSTSRPGSPTSPSTLSIAEHSSEDALPSKSYNVILIGDSSVGKTSFMKRVQTGQFSLDLPASVGTDSCISPVLVDGKRVVLQLWDTAGQERFHSITRQIFHKAQAFLLMYDITSSQSFSDISYWATCIQESATDDVTIVLLGNKSDSATGRQVQHCDGEALAKEYNFEFMECSAATGHNVTPSLETVARVLSKKCDTREEAMQLRQEPQKKKPSGCC